jgi:hypothetical protein
LTTNQSAHRIILLNFTVQEAETIAKAGYNVERGYVGEGVEVTSYLPYATPHPLYEYDILFYNSEISKEVVEEFQGHQRSGLQDPGFRNTVSSFKTPPLVRVSFIGKSTGFTNLVSGGLPLVNLTRADQNVSSLLEDQDTSHRIPELHELLTNLKTQVSSVGMFFDAGPFTTIWNMGVLSTRNGHQVMGYGTFGGTQSNLPSYIILPRMKNLPQTVLQILGCLESVAPQLFPDLSRKGWLQGEEFLLPDEKAVRKSIEEKIEEARRFIDSKNEEMQVLAEKNAFVRGLLIAKEDPALPPEQRLSGVVKAALEYLDFKVEDIDQKIKTAIRKEDFWVRDGKFLAITEVSGTGNKNPKVKEFHDILGRMATLYKRQNELVLPSGVDVAGLLVLNYDMGNHPSRRPRVYIGADAHIAETAVEQNIGILTTVELHKIVMAVKKGLLPKDAARELLKKPGRIEYVEEKRTD